MYSISFNATEQITNVIEYSRSSFYNHFIFGTPLSISECPLAEFVTSPLDQEKIPFVFLPLSSGQAVYPSARIRISDGDDSDLAISPSSSSYISENLENVSPGEESKANENDDEPICVVSSTDLMYRDGWNNLEKIYNSLSSSSLLPSSGKNDANSKTSDNFYHHPLRLVQHPNAKTSLQVNSNHTIFINVFSYIIGLVYVR